MKSDVVVLGSHAKIINAFRDYKLLTPKNSPADLFFLSSLIGLYYGETGEVDNIGEYKSEISRLYAVNNPDILRLISTFENLEDKYNGIDLTVSEIFMDEEKTNSSSKMQKIKDHAYFGLERLNDEFFDEQMKVTNELDIILMIEKKVMSTTELDKMESPKKVIEEISFEELINDDL